MSGLFYNLGRRLGRAAVPAVRKSKWIWQGLTGNEEDRLRAEAELGRTLATELRLALEPASDPQTGELLNEICRRVASHTTEKRRVFRCELMRADDPNAIALPGGFLFVSDSMVTLCERSPEALAFVIGHEMAHVIRGDAWDRMLSQTAIQAVSVASRQAGHLGYWLRQQGIPLLQKAYARQGELEADRLGLRLAIAAGFSPNGAIALFHRVRELEPDPPALGEYFSSHPPASERIAQLEAVVKTLKPRG